MTTAAPTAANAPSSTRPAALLPEPVDDAPEDDEGEDETTAEVFHLTPSELRKASTTVVLIRSLPPHVPTCASQMHDQRQDKVRRE